MGRWNWWGVSCVLLVGALVTVPPAVTAEIDLDPGPDSVPLDSASAFLTAALTLLFGRDQGVVFVGPQVHNIFAGDPHEVIGELHGGFRFAVAGPDPNPTHVCTQLRVYDYVIYNSDGKLRNIYADVNPEDSGYGNVSSVYPWTVRQAFEAAMPDIEQDLAGLNWDPYTFYSKYIELFFPLNIQLHSNLLIPPEPVVHGQLYNRKELYVTNDGNVRKFPLVNTPFVASGAEFVDSTTGDLLLTVRPGWKLTVTSVVKPQRMPKLSIDVVEKHLTHTTLFRSF